MFASPLSSLLMQRETDRTHGQATEEVLGSGPWCWYWSEKAPGEEVTPSGSQPDQGSGEGPQGGSTAWAKAWENTDGPKQGGGGQMCRSVDGFPRLGAALRGPEAGKAWCVQERGSPVDSGWAEEGVGLGP